MKMDLGDWLAAAKLEAESAAALQALAPDELGQTFHFRTRQELLEWDDIDRLVRREVICAHEAGHVLIAHSEGLVCPTVRVSRSGHFGIADGNLVADSLPLDEDWGSGKARDVAVAAIRMQLAGGVAQMIHLRRVYGCHEVTSNGARAKWLLSGTEHDLDGALGVALTMTSGNIRKTTALLRRCRSDVLRWFSEPLGSAALETLTANLQESGRLTHSDVKRVVTACKRRLQRAFPNSRGFGLKKGRRKKR